MRAAGARRQACLRPPGAPRAGRGPPPPHGLVQLQQVVGQGDQRPLPLGLGHSAQAQAAKAARFNLAEDRLDDRLAPSVQRLPLRRSQLGLHPSFEG